MLRSNEFFFLQRACKLTFFHDLNLSCVLYVQFLFLPFSLIIKATVGTFIQPRVFVKPITCQQVRLCDIKLTRCDPRPFVCGHSAEIITLLFFVFALNSSLVQTEIISNYNYICINSFKFLHCEQWYISLEEVGGGAILCFYVMGP